MQLKISQVIAGMTVNQGRTTPGMVAQVDDRVDISIAAHLCCTSWK